eukprot:8293370-Lingulodinium_polyedra.AAC.1
MRSAHHGPAGCEILAQQGFLCGASERANGPHLLAAAPELAPHLGPCSAQRPIRSGHPEAS